MTCRNTLRLLALLTTAALPLMGATLPLNGLWQVAAGKADKPPESFDHSVPVPGYLDQAEPAFSGVGRLPVFWAPHGHTPPDYGWFWYRRSFELPS